MQFVLDKLYSSQEEKVKRQVQIHVGEKKFRKLFR